MYSSRTRVSTNYLAKITIVYNRYFQLDDINQNYTLLILRSSVLKDGLEKKSDYFLNFLTRPVDSHVNRASFY